MRAVITSCTVMLVFPATFGTTPHCNYGVIVGEVEQRKWPTFGGGESLETLQGLGNDRCVLTQEGS